MNVLNSDQNNNENNVNVVPELFSKELEEILQKIFLFLDPKSLKNSKLTCSRWREFIDTRIWRSPSARNVLHGRLSANWKNGDQVKVSKVRLDFYPSIAVCDDAVMVFGDEDTGRCRVLNSSIHELLYDTTLHPLHPLVDDISIGQDFICFFSHNLFVTIVDKFTGNTEFKEVMDDQNYSVKMIGNIIFAGKLNGDLLILSTKNPKTFEWTKEKQKTGIHNDDEYSYFCISGGKNYILIVAVQTAP